MNDSLAFNEITRRVYESAYAYGPDTKEWTLDHSISFDDVMR